MIAWPEPDTFVLQHRPFRETSALVRILTRSAGLVRTLWRDTTTPIYLFQPYHSQLGLTSGWPILRSIEVAGQVLRLPGQRAYMGLYLNELCAALLPPGVPDDRFFGVYYSTLRALQHGDDAEPWLRFLEQGLLEAMGMGIDWVTDSQGHRILPGKFYCFDGVNRFGPRGGTQAQAWRGQVILALARSDYRQREVRLCARAIMRQALDYHLQGQPVRARELFYSAVDEENR